MEQSQVEERIRSIRMRFIGALPQFIRDTSERWQKLRHTGWNPVLAKELQVFAHRLSGSGATFGFPEISRTARQLDISLGEVLAQTSEPTPEHTLNLDRQVHDLLRTMRAGQEEKAAAPAEAPTPVEPAAKPGQLVLVIDDDELLRARLAVLLEGSGYRVATAADPDAATVMLHKIVPDVVLLDLMFPGRGRPAFDVVQTIRDLTGRRTPVAIISGRADFSSRLEAVRAGADTYLAKPLDQNQLLKVVAQLASSELDGLRCLVVDDDELLARQLVEWLRDDGIIAESVSDPRDSWLKVREFHPDVVVLDVNMPECDGIELATLLRQDPQTSLLPIIFLTADNDDRTRQNAIAAGADDFLAKPITQAALIQSISTRARLGKRMQEQARRVTQQAPQQSGLSRHFFFNELERALDDADDGPVRMALVLMGLTEAPHILKDHGAPGLAEVHEQWETRLANASITQWSMLGENTVALLLPRDTASGQRTRVRKLTTQLSATPYRLKDKDIPSDLGVVIVHLSRSQATLSSILLQGEQLLGMAFAGGPGTIKEGFAGASGTEAADSSGQLPLDKLRAVYQPIVTIDGVGSPVHAVLARVADRDGHLLPTGRFLAVLEKRGWLPELDAWVFRLAHKTLTEQIGANVAMFLVVHASTQSLSSAIYLETVRAVLAAEPMRNENQCLVIAIPESAGITHRTAAEQLAQALPAAGGGLMLTGYGSTTSSIAVLEHLRPLFVRLDEPLTQRLESGSNTPEDQKLLDAALAANTSVIASGIENARSLSALWAKGVRRFQGYFIQEPSAVLETSGEQ